MNRSSWVLKCAIIFGSICVFSLPVYLLLFAEKAKTPVHLKTLIQKTPSLNSLSPRFFSDYLSLRPKGNYLKIDKLDIGKINSKLESFPIFKKVEAVFSHQGQLEIYYELRTPYAYLKDFSQLALDQEGYVIPANLFFSPKKLPFVYLGLHSITWNSSHDMTLVKQIIDAIAPFENQTLKLELIDVSLLSHKLASHREVVVTVSYNKHSHYLRIKPQLVDLAISRYVQLFHEKHLGSTLDQDLIFDARISKFATLKPLASSQEVKSK